MVLKNVRIGNKTWSFGHRQTDSASSAQQTSDGGYIIAGATYSEGWIGWFIKVDKNGNEQWNNSFTKLTYATLLKR